MNKMYNNESAEGEGLYNNLMNDVVYWQGSQLLTNSQKPRLGLFSKLLAATPVFMYDHPFFEQAFPKGFVTENTIMISANFYKTVLMNEPQKGSDTKYNSTGMLLVKYLLTMIEDKYEIKFSNIENSKINYMIMSKEYHHGGESYLKEQLRDTIPFISLNDLVYFAQQNNIDSIETIKELGSKNDFCGDILFKSTEVHDIKNPLYKLVNKVVEDQEVLEIGKMTLEEFREEYQHSVNNVKTKVVFEALHNLAEQVLSKPPVEIIEEAKKQWIPFLMELNDINFSYALNDFKEQLMVLHSNKLNFSLNGPEGILQSLSMVLQKTDENLSEYKKDRIISIMSNVDAAQSPVRSMKK